MSFILITPCRDEINSLPLLCNAILSQSKKPLLWVIVDDRSTDGSSSIIRDMENQYPWIKGMYLTEVCEYMGSHYSRVCRQGFKFALNYCSDNDVEYEFISLIDADNIPECSYFEKLMLELENDSSLGIISGISAFVNFSEIKRSNDILNLFINYDSLDVQLSKTDLPMGSARMWKKKCFNDTGGYLDVFSPDAVSNVKAKMNGWSTKRISNAYIIERAAFEYQGIWERSKENGFYYYYLWHPLIYVLAKSVKRSFKKPYYSGIRELYGYLVACAFRRERINDSDVRNYYQNKGLREIMIQFKIMRDV